MWWRRALSGGASAYPCRRCFSSAATSYAVDTIILRSLKDHYLEVNKMSPPPKVNPPQPYTIIKGALDQDGPVLKRTYKDTEQISLSVMKLTNLVPPGADQEANEKYDDQLLLHVEISKQESEESLHFLCALYDDVIGIHSVSLRPKMGKEIGENIQLETAHKSQGRMFHALDENVQDAFHSYIETRGITKELFPFLQAWLYVKDHRSLTKWFKSVGTFIGDKYI